MKRIIKPNQITDLSPTKAEEPTTDISVARLIDDSLLALHREVKNLLMLSARGKLDANNARDLRDHLKLLFELKDRESESLRGLTDEQLKDKVKAALDDSN